MYPEGIIVVDQRGVECGDEGAEDVPPDHGGDGGEPPQPGGRAAQEPLLLHSSPQHLLLLLLGLPPSARIAHRRVATSRNRGVRPLDMIDLQLFQSSERVDYWSFAWQDSNPEEYDIHR
ncbi:hypothetical protein CEXT_683271 [Caerostris extrusa]|uniref:Uncharacterized protein n=1 Tax=Caerostris extrusa TaxID=172846 RepID=A0AAV4V8Z8_CAEEX|nr:hypothetical protein CEXT_683271 [Caerostris extrusa]